MTKRRQQRYTDEQRAAALVVLAMNNNNYTQTGKALGIPPQTIKNWKSNGVRSHSTELVSQTKYEIQAMLMAEVKAMIGVMSKAKYKKASVQQLYTSIAIAVDKIMILDPDYVSENPNTTINIQAQAQQVDYRSDLAGIAPGSVRDRDSSSTD